MYVRPEGYCQIVKTVYISISCLLSTCISFIYNMLLTAARVLCLALTYARCVHPDHDQNVDALFPSSASFRIDSARDICTQTAHGITSHHTTHRMTLWSVYPRWSATMCKWHAGMKTPARQQCSHTVDMLPIYTYIYIFCCVLQKGNYLGARLVSWMSCVCDRSSLSPRGSSSFLSLFETADAKIDVSHICNTTRFQADDEQRSTKQKKNSTKWICNANTIHLPNMCVFVSWQSKTRSPVQHYNTVFCWMLWMATEQGTHT